MSCECTTEFRCSIVQGFFEEFVTAGPGPPRAAVVRGYTQHLEDAGLLIDRPPGTEVWPTLSPFSLRT